GGGRQREHLLVGNLRSGDVVKPNGHATRGFDQLDGERSPQRLVDPVIQRAGCTVGRWRRPQVDDLETIAEIEVAPHNGPYRVEAGAGHHDEPRLYSRRVLEDDRDAFPFDLTGVLSSGYRDVKGVRQDRSCQCDGAGEES